MHLLFNTLNPQLYINREMELKVLAKYPFLGVAREYVSSLALDLGGIVDHPMYSACVELAHNRLLHFARGMEYSPTPETDKLSLELILLSYPVARVVASLMKNDMLYKRYARGEAEAVGSMLRREDKVVVGKVISDLGIELKDSRIDSLTYLKLARELAKRDPRWRLVNRTVDDGLVVVADSELPDLLKEAVYYRILEPVDVKNPPKKLRTIANEIKNLLIEPVEVEFKGDLDFEALPPCIRKMLALLEAGEASHHVMFILATFHSNLGLGEGRVVEVFKASPKFDEEKTRYQLKFLLGEQSGTKYTCPACTTIKSYGLCTKDCGVKHPLQFYRRNYRRRSDDEGRE